MHQPQQTDFRHVCRRPWGETEFCGCFATTKAKDRLSVQLLILGRSDVRREPVRVDSPNSDQVSSPPDITARSIPTHPPGPKSGHESPSGPQERNRPRTLRHVISTRYLYQPPNF